MTQEGQRGEGAESACSPGDQILNVLDQGCVYTPGERPERFSPGGSRHLARLRGKKTIDPN